MNAPLTSAIDRYRYSRRAALFGIDSTTMRARSRACSAMPTGSAS
jgi:hypothetical protein